MVKIFLIHSKNLFILRFPGSPADKAGLCIDDEVISMNDENIEHMTFDQVRKILKERNVRGSIKMIVKTYEGKNHSLQLISSNLFLLRYYR
jgi:C-terminal processing protease CtpA/Prc